MTIETATYISSLNSANPGASDAISEGDDHIRLLKSTIKATFPNVAGAATPSHTELNYVTGVTSAIQTQINAKAPSVSPTFTTPALGTPASGVLTNCTGSASGLAAGAIVGGAAGSIPYQSAGSTTLFLAAGTSGQALLSGGAGAPTWGTLSYVGLTGSETIAGVKTFSSQPVLPQAPTAGTALATTSGTTADFTSIPSWVRRITIALNRVSTNGTSNLQIQIGSGSFTTSGYSGEASMGATAAFNSAAYLVTAAITTTSQASGLVTLLHIGGNVWVEAGTVGNTDTNYVNISGGAITLGGVLDRVRLTTANGTDTFDNGSVNIYYE